MATRLNPLGLSLLMESMDDEEMPPIRRERRPDPTAATMGKVGSEGPNNHAATATPVAPPLQPEPQATPAVNSTVPPQYSMIMSVIPGEKTNILGKWRIRLARQEGTGAPTKASVDAALAKNPHQPLYPYYYDIAGDKVLLYDIRQRPKAEGFGQHLATTSMPMASYKSKLVEIQNTIEELKAQLLNLDPADPAAVKLQKEIRTKEYWVKADTTDEDAKPEPAEEPAQAAVAPAAVTPATPQAPAKPADLTQVSDPAQMAQIRDPKFVRYWAEQTLGGIKREFIAVLANRRDEIVDEYGDDWYRTLLQANADAYDIILEMSKNPQKFKPEAFKQDVLQALQDKIAEVREGGDDEAEIYAGQLEEVAEWIATQPVGPNR